MMRFEKDDAFRKLFRDYPMILIRADEQMDYGAFRTPLKELLAVFPFRKDRKEMREYIRKNEEYKRLDRDTLEAIAVMTDNRKLWKRWNCFKMKKRATICTKRWEAFSWMVWRKEERKAGKQESGR